jgi:glycosyltransferase involved in cell wall biosynthesis
MMQKINILFITVRSDHGGGPKHLDLLIRYLPEHFNIFVACPMDAPYYPMWLDNPKVIKILTIPHRKLSILKTLALSRFCNSNRIEIVHSHGKGAGIYSRMLKILNYKLKIVHTFHGIHVQQYSDFTRRIYILFERALRNVTTAFINVSEGENKICKELKFANNNTLVKIIYNGIELPQPTNNFSVMEFLKGKFVVISISRFDFSKNMRLAFNVAKTLKEEDIYFLWVGDGEDLKELEEASKNNNLKIIFIGFQENVADYLLISSLYLSTSRWEGLPLALLEASSLGIPLIATNVTGNNEVVVNGVNGYLFENGNYKEAADKIYSLYLNNDLCQRFAEESKKRFKSLFTVQKMVTETCALYLEILKTSNKIN